MGSSRLVATTVIVALTVLAQDTSAATILLDASTQVVAIGSDPSGLNNSVPLVDHAGAVRVTASGDASFGSNPGEIYNSAVVAYRDHAGFGQYAVAPMNSAAGVVIDGSHYNYALLTDTAGLHVGNTGTAAISQLSMASLLLAGGNIVAGSTTSAQTGVAQISGANAAFFNTTPVGVPQNFNVTVTGQAFWGAGPNDQYGSIVVQYRDSTNGITYDSLPIGSSRNYFGFNFRVFLTDFTATAADNSGALTVDLVVPEPASFVTLAALAAATFLARPRRRAA